MLLFTLQCLFILLLLIPWGGLPAALNAPPVWIACVLLIDSIGLAIWTLRHNRPGNFGFLPPPATSSHLITSGPYQYIRHPMYLAVLLFTLAVVLFYASPWRWLAWFALVMTLHLKARVEEKLLCARFPEYAGYMTRSRAILPFIL